MKLICFFLLVSIIAFSFAKETENLEQNNVERKDEDFDAMGEENKHSLLEFLPEDKREGKRTMKGCAKDGQPCNGDDCNCCDSNSHCKCFLWIKHINNCVCSIGDSSENYATCLKKQKECEGRIGCSKPSNKCIGEYPKCRRRNGK